MAPKAATRAAARSRTPRGETLRTCGLCDRYTLCRRYAEQRTHLCAICYEFGEFQTAYIGMPRLAATMEPIVAAALREARRLLHEAEHGAELSSGEGQVPTPSISR